MRNLLRFPRSLALGVVVTLLWSPGAHAQSIASSFDELRQLVKVGETVVVTGADGRETKGRIEGLTASTLVVRAPELRAFAEGDVTRIRRSDSVWNGALIGAGAGGAIALWGIGTTRGTSDAFYGWAYVGSWLAPAAGAVAGAFIDRSIGGASVFVVPSFRRASVSVSPLIGARGRGAAVSIRY